MSKGDIMKAYMLTLFGIIYLIGIVAAFPLEVNQSNVLRAKNFLKDQQEINNGFGDIGLSCWVALAVHALNETPDSWRVNESSQSLAEYIEANVNNLDKSKATDWEKLLLAVAAMKKSPYNFGNMDIVAKVLNFFNNSQFGSPDMLNDDFWAVIALCAANECNSSEVEASIDFIINNQNSDGGWSWSVGSSSDVDDTAAAIMALSSAGIPPESEEITKALDFLKTQQSSNGGFLSWGSTNADTDAWAIMALLAANEHPLGSKWLVNRSSAVDDLLSFQNVNGSFNYSRSYPDLSRVLNTAFAINALTGKPYSTIRHKPIRINMRLVYEDSELNYTEMWIDNVVSIIDSGGVYHVIEKPTPINALEKLRRNNQLTYITQYFADWNALYVSEINSISASGSDGWNYRVNHMMPSIGADRFILSNDDELLWYYGKWDDKELRINAQKDIVKCNEDLLVTVEFFNITAEEWQTMPNSTVIYPPNNKTTNATGNAIISFAASGNYVIYATKKGCISSNKLNITVVEESNDNSVHLSAEIVPAVSFMVSPGSIDFGKIAPGSRKEGNNITITNLGSWDIIVNASLSESGSFFMNYLLLDDMPIDAFSLLIPAEVTYTSEREITTMIDIPNDYRGAGEHHAVLTFWATGIEP